jgi:hypothetical protein
LLFIEKLWELFFNSYFNPFSDSPPGTSSLPMQSTSKNPQFPVKDQQSGARNDTQAKETDPPVDGPEKDTATIRVGGHSNNSGTTTANEQRSNSVSNSIDETTASKSDGRAQREVKSLKKQFESKQIDSNGGGTKYPKGL